MEKLNCPHCGAGFKYIYEELVKCSYCGNICLIEFKKEKEKVCISFQQPRYVTHMTANSACTYYKL